MGLLEPSVATPMFEHLEGKVIQLLKKNNKAEKVDTHSGPSQGETRLLWHPVDRLRLLSKLRILGPITPLVSFHKCFISCTAECPDIYTLYNAVTNIIS
jgi:hypothetical protein